MKRHVRRVHRPSNSGLTLEVNLEPRLKYEETCAEEDSKRAENSLCVFSTIVWNVYDDLDDRWEKQREKLSSFLSSNKI